MPARCELLWLLMVTSDWQAAEVHIGDFTARRVLPKRVCRSVGPFCFLDHMGPQTRAM